VPLGRFERPACGLGILHSTLISIYIQYGSSGNEKKVDQELKPLKQYLEKIGLLKKEEKVTKK
jgi:hypothetical protein